MNAAARAALVSFFASPKPAYAREEVAPLFEPGVLSDLFEDGDAPRFGRKTHKSRGSVADFIYGFVNPLDVAAAVATVDPASELAAQPVTVNLPRWVLRELENAAKVQQSTVERILAAELLVAIEGEQSAEFEGAAKIDYAAVTVPSEVQR